MNSTSMETVLLSPWYSRAERKQLYHQLFSADVDDQLRAIRHIDVWKARSYPRVPLGIEVTAALIRALTFGSKALSDHRLAFEEQDMEAVFCMALIRFVNLVTEVGQVMNYQLSINAIAQRMGVPEWIVDLRHGATHSNLPSLDVLRTAATWSLEWVKANYWETEECVIEDVAVSCPAYKYKDIRRVLSYLRTELMKAKGTSQIKKAMEIFDTEKRRLLKSISRWEFVQEMMCDGFLFPASQQADPSEWDNGRVITAIKKQLSNWKPFLNSLHMMGAIPELLTALHLEGMRRPSSRGKVAATWILFLLKTFSSQGKRQSTKMLKNRSLYKMLLQLNPKHLEIVGSCLPKQKREQLLGLARKKVTRSLMTHATGRPSQGYIPNEEKVPTSCQQSLEAKRCPLGMLPSQYGMDILDLELPMHVDHICHRKDLPSDLIDWDISQRRADKTERNVPHLL